MNINGYITDNESGFYTIEDNNLLFAPNNVYGPGFTLERERHADYTYPVNGWTWFDTVTAACTTYNLSLSTYLKAEEPIQDKLPARLNRPRV